MNRFLVGPFFSDMKMEPVKDQLFNINLIRRMLHIQMALFSEEILSNVESNLPQNEQNIFFFSLFDEKNRLTHFLYKKLSPFAASFIKYGLSFVLSSITSLFILFQERKNPYGQY